MSIFLGGAIFVEKNAGGCWAGKLWFYVPSIAGLACLPGLGLLGYLRLVPASLALPAPATTTAARSATTAVVVVAWCRQGERGRYEARIAKQAKARQASQARDGWDI